MLTIAHLSDVHLGPMPALRLRDLTPKRLTGMANWHRSRKHRHRGEVLAAMLADLRMQGPDHVVVTGDICNVGIPSEMTAALTWLETLGSPDRVTVVPGNHDTYATLRGDPGLGRWQAYMSGAVEGAVKRRSDAVPFPFVRRLGPVALIGLSSAVPTPVFRATGLVGAEQRRATTEVLRQLGTEGLVRVVLIHHPPLPGQAAPTCALTDAAEVTAMFGEAGAELVLHGHNHRAMVAVAPHARGPIPIVGVPSASHDRHHGHAEPARYNLYRIEAGIGGCRITMTSRGISERSHEVVTVEERELMPFRVEPR